MQFQLNETQQAIMNSRSLETFIIYNSRQMGKTLLYKHFALRYFQEREKKRASQEALSRFKLNSSYFMYRNKRGGWRNY